MGKRKNMKNRKIAKSARSARKKIGARIFIAYVDIHLIFLSPTMFAYGKTRKEPYPLTIITSLVIIIFIFFF